MALVHVMSIDNELPNETDNVILFTEAITG